LCIESGLGYGTHRVLSPATSLVLAYLYCGVPGCKCPLHFPQQCDPLLSSERDPCIGTYISSPNPQTGEIRLGQDLAQTYAQLLRTYEVMEATVETLNLSMSPEGLRGLVSTRLVPDTSLLVVQVQYTDPLLTAEIANELANQLILLSPTNLTPEQQAQIDIATDQINALRDELVILRTELETVDTALTNAQDSESISNLIDQRNILYEQINERSGNIASFTNTIANYQQRTNAVEIVETARIPRSAVSSSPITGAILGALTGGALAFGLVLVLEYMNDTFRTNAEVAQVLSLPVLGVIAKLGRKKGAYRDRLISKDLFSQAHEQYRTLRTNILFRTPEDAQHVYLVTSAMPSEGKTLTVANLAISMALTDTRVLLVDADMRKPKIHEAFQLNNDMGLSTLLTSQQTDISVNGNHADMNLLERNVDWIRQCVQDSGIPNLKIMTSGYPPANPAELLGSTQMNLLAHALREIFDVDVVLFDTPPCLVVSDSMLLAANVQANVLLIVEANRSRRSAVLRAKERFTNIHYDVMGAILNNANPRDEDYYGYRNNYYYYYNEEQDKKEKPILS